ncbi:TPA: hypothetical protein N0F65_001964 [Lagenidium giganteum]|uniref:PX domain-containing protein n=1 Tax=Lagenidium giganteum TaxID=4803 RepID=A0AAV2YQ25_9STRA|nr:TPA: hypothetical protein N0F65_001964 [Lagenidium giganteum]
MREIEALATGMELGLNGLFVVVGIVYGSKVLAPLPKTYLSEIAFPFDGMSTVIMWMEHRRGRVPSAFVRCFWLLKWLLTTYVLVAHQRISHISLMAEQSTIAIALGATIYIAMTILAVLAVCPSTPVTVDLLLRPSVDTPSAYLQSSFRGSSRKRYGSLQGYDIITKSGVDSEGSTIVSSQNVISISIPSSTTSIWGKNHFVSYKIVVKTEEDLWTIRRQYSDFVVLHEELPEEVKQGCKLPPEENARKFLSWKGRPHSLKAKLERYLKDVLRHPALEAHASQSLCDFLEMEYVEEELLRSYHSVPKV